MVGITAGILSSLQTPLYRATARVLLTPNDPTQQLNPGGGNGLVGNDPERYVAGQINIVLSEGVAVEAAKTLEGVSVGEIEGSTSVGQDGASNVLKISATGTDPAQVRDIADAVAKGYIENRRQAAVSGLQRAADDIQDKLGPIQARIAELDTQIGAVPAATGATSALVSPVKPGGAQITPTSPQVDPGLSASAGAPTTQEGLKAARYAAAIQYETLYSRQQELLVDITLKRGDAELIALARVPGVPISPHPKRDGALGVSVGLLLGIGIAIIREHYGDRLRSAQEVERLTGLPMLTQIPYEADAAKSPSTLAVVERPLSVLSESMRSLRTSIQYMAIDRPMKLLVVTSAFPSEGKSLVAANLAAVFAQAGFRTLLVSADLRRSSVEGMFGELAKSRGLTGVLAPFSANGHGGSESLGSLQVGVANGTDNNSALVRTAVPNLYILPSGSTPPNPAELLGSRRMEAMLADYAADFDMIVIDTPPVLAVTDAAVLASRADGVVLVAAVNETRRDGLRRAKSVLEAAGGRILGTVVNKMTKSQGYYNYDSTYYGSYTSDRRKWRGWSRPGQAKTEAKAKAPAGTS